MIDTTSCILLQCVRVKLGSDMILFVLRERVDRLNDSYCTVLCITVSNTSYEMSRMKQEGINDCEGPKILFTHA